LRRHNPEGGIVLRPSSSLRLLDDTVQYRLRRRASICGAIRTALGLVLLPKAPWTETPSWPSDAETRTVTSEFMNQNCRAAAGEVVMAPS
jgi:hypothetical protein